MKFLLMLGLALFLFTGSALAGTKLFVTNLPLTMDDVEFREVFEQFGVVLSAKIVRDPKTQASRGSGIVEMERNEDALAAIRVLNGYQMEGRALKIVQMDDRPTRPGGGGGSGGKAEKVLDAAAATALVTEATGWLAGLIDDEEITDTITSSWDERDDFIGKTRTQVLDLMLIDAKNAITDKTAQDRFVKGWNAKAGPVRPAQKAPGRG